MASFGNFETEREVYSDAIHTVYAARKPGETTQYAVKVFSIQRIGFEDETRTEIESLLGDLERSRIKCIEIQRKAAESSAFVAPVLETGYDERGVWYATGFYPRSVNRIISGRVALTREPLLHILRSIAQGALDLKRTCGRSHGDIQPSNVQISKSDQLTEAAVLLSDPLPGGEEEAARYEVADLRAIGQILLQLVRQRAIGDEHGFLILPILASPEWNRLFGKDTERWLSLCNQLLDPKLSLDHLTLEKVLAELEQLQPKAPVSGKLLMAAAVAVVLLAGAGFIVSQLMNYKKVVFTSDPPRATILVNGKPEGPTPLTLKLKKGKYSIQARQDTLRLLERNAELVVDGGNTKPLHFTFAYGSVMITSEPPGANIINNGTLLGKTPLTIPIVAADVPVKYELSLSEHGSRTVQGVVSNGQQLALSEKLPLDRESGTVDMESIPTGVPVFWNGKLLTPDSGTPAKTTLEQGSYTLTAVHPDLGTQQVAVVVKRGDATPAKFYFPSGRVSLNSTPSDAVVWVGTNRIGSTPKSATRPPGKTTFRFELPGYETNSVEVMVTDKGFHSVSPILKILAGFVDVVSDPPGAQITDLDHPEKVLATTTANGPARIPLPPGKHALRAAYGELKPVESPRFDIKVGQPTPLAPFVFEYGTVVFADVGPPDVAGELSIQRGGTRPVKVGERILQKPGEPVSYRIEAPGYEPVANNIAVANKETKPIRLALARKTVPVKLSSDPPGARFFTADGTELKAGEQGFLLPWGTIDLVARFGRLGALTNTSVPIRLQGPNAIPLFKFDYGTVILTNLPESVIVKEGDEELIVQSGSLKFAYERTGFHKYDLYDSGEKLDTISTNITAALNFLRSAVDPNHWINSKKIGFSWVPGLPGGGLWPGPGSLPRGTPGGLVSQFEITQAQYKLMSGTNPSTYLSGGDRYPVENLTWAEAVAFCDWLNKNDTTKPEGWNYTLPSDQQYVFFAADADSLPRVSSEGIDRASRPTHPAEVGSTHKPNRFRLYDVVGNVSEWVLDHDPDPAKKDRFYRGGSYLNFTARTVAVNAREGNREKDSNIGFRVILIPR